MEILAFFLYIVWRENVCDFSVTSEKTLENMTLDLGKYWLSGEETFLTDCTSLSCTRQYEFCCVKTAVFQTPQQLYALQKNLDFSEILEISKFQFFWKIILRMKFSLGYPFSP